MLGLRTRPRRCEWRRETKSFCEHIFPLPGTRASGSSAWRPMPHTGSKELASANMFVPVLQRCYFIVGFCKTLAKLPARTAFSRTRFQTALSKLRAPRPMPLCALGSGEDIMSSAARWSWKRRAFYAIINCSAQECDTSSTTNNEGDHCGRQEGGCQNSTTSSVEYSNLGSKDRRCRGIGEYLGAGRVLLRERWAPGARDESGPTDPCLVSPLLRGEKWPEGARAALDDRCQRSKEARGSEPVLLDECGDYSACGGITLRLI